MHRLVYPQYQHRTPGARGWRVVDGRLESAMTIYTPDSPVMGDTLGSAEAWMAYFLSVGVNHPEDVQQYTETMHTYGPQVRIPAQVAICQAIHETSEDRDGDGVFIPFTSEAWDYRNPAGIGVTSNAERGRYTFPHGRAAAFAHLIRLCWYTQGVVPDVLKPFEHFNPHPLPESVRGKRHTLREFGHSDWRAYPTWAASDVYGDKWAQTLNRYAHVFAGATTPPDAGGGGTDVATKPKIIQGYTPKIIDKWIHVTQDGYTGVQRFIRNRNGQKIRVLKWHVMEGTMWGSWIHAHAVKASWTVQIGKNGDIWRTVEERHGPWTNGDVNKPSQQMVSIMNRYGWDPNVYTLSVEHEGKSGGLPYTDAQLKASVWQAWDWITRYGDDLVVLVPLGHYETNSVHRPNCPDPEWQGHPFIAQMKQHLGDRVADHDVIIGDDKLWPVRLDDGTVWDGAHDVIVTSGAQPVKVFADKRTVTVTASVLNSRQWASTAANLTRHAKETGETIDVLGAVEGEVVNDEGRWWVDALGNRYWSGGTAEKPDMTWNPPEHPGDPEPPDDEPHLPDYGNHVGKVPQVVNGTLYYEFWDDEDPAPGHVKTAIDSGNLRKWAGVGEAVGTVREGDEVRVTHYVYGEPVEYDGGGMENMWYIVDPGDGRDPILHGARVWAGLFNERPN